MVQEKIHSKTFDQTLVGKNEKTKVQKNSEKINLNLRGEAIGYCTRCLKQSYVYPVKMAHLCDWKEHNPQDRELRMLVERVWGDEFITGDKL